MTKATQTTVIETTAAAVAPKAPSKMELSRKIFAEVNQMTTEELAGKSQRKVFIERAVAEIAATAKGAATYFQNLTNESRGKPLYTKQTKVAKADVPAAEQETAGAATEAQSAADETAAPVAEKQEEAAA